MYAGLTMQERASDFGRKLLAVVVLIFALALLLKFVIGLVAGFIHLVFFVLVAVAVVAAVAWALNVL
jgi:membrane protein required for beta-lactamase induction